MERDYKSLRLALGKTQADMAREIGVSLLTYQLWERNVSNPNPENKIKLFKALEIKE
jgi:DNA-binding XRE family transcriptional regulator